MLGINKYLLELWSSILLQCLEHHCALKKCVYLVSELFM